MPVPLSDRVPSSTPVSLAAGRAVPWRIALRDRWCCRFLGLISCGAWSSAHRCVVALLGALSLFAQAQPSTNRPVVMIVPYPAGGPSDFVARLLQPGYERQFGQALVVENVGGASGSLGVQRVLDAPADGRTQLLATPMELVLAPSALPAVRFKAEDLRLAGMISSTSVLLLVRHDLPVRNLDELLAWGSGKSLNAGNAGVGSLYELMARRLAVLTGLSLNHVPYKGVGPMLNDLAGGQLDLAFVPLAGPVPAMIKEGRVRALGLSSPQIHAMLPHVPPLSHHRLLPGFHFDLWIAVVVPRTTPDAERAQINANVIAVIQQPEVRRGLESTGASTASAMTLQQLDELYSAEIARYRSMLGPSVAPP